ncbi:uncharacterized protein J3R85_004086 [Psidium guajava]|nr:uncharacterized protein J3R85_004086 [Psidium guajava]
MARIVRSCLQSLMKWVNYVMGMVGVAMLLYGFWMVRVWQRDMDEGSSFYSTAPWFIYAFLGMGVILCLIAWIGRVAADSANGCCLSCYMLIMSLLILIEATVAADILLNSDWEKDLPEDPTGRFSDFEDFVKSNFDVFKWIGLLILLAQGSSVLFTIVLRSARSHRGPNYDVDDEYPPTKLPLLGHLSPPPPYAVAPPPFASIK